MDLAGDTGFCMIESAQHENKMLRFKQKLRCCTPVYKESWLALSSLTECYIKSRMYKLKCKKNKVYVGETGWKSEYRLSDHKQGEGNRTTNGLRAIHFVQENHKFVNLLEKYEMKWDMCS